MSLTKSIKEELDRDCEHRFIVIEEECYYEYTKRKWGKNCKLCQNNSALAARIADRISEKGTESK